MHKIEVLSMLKEIASANTIVINTIQEVNEFVNSHCEEWDTTVAFASRYYKAFGRDDFLSAIEIQNLFKHARRVARYGIGDITFANVLDMFALESPELISITAEHMYWATNNVYYKLVKLLSEEITDSYNIYYRKCKDSVIKVLDNMRDELLGVYILDFMVGCYDVGFEYLRYQLYPVKKKLGSVYKVIEILAEVENTLECYKISRLNNYTLCQRVSMLFCIDIGNTLMNKDVLDTLEKSILDKESSEGKLKIALLMWLKQIIDVHEELCSV